MACYTESSTTNPQLKTIDPLDVCPPVIPSQMHSDSPTTDIPVDIIASTKPPPEPPDYDSDDSVEEVVLASAMDLQASARWAATVNCARQPQAKKSVSDSLSFMGDNYTPAAEDNYFPAGSLFDTSRPQSPHDVQSFQRYIYRESSTTSLSICWTLIPGSRHCRFQCYIWDT